MSKFTVGEIPEFRKVRRRASERESAIKSLPHGKALRFELEGRVPEKMRCSLVMSARRAGVRVHTSIQDGAVFVWRREPDAEVPRG